MLNTICIISLFCYTRNCPNKILIKIDMVTDEGNSWNEFGVAVQNLATSKNPSVVNTICITSSFCYTRVIMYHQFILLQSCYTLTKFTWWLIKATVKMRSDTEDEIGVAVQSWLWVRVDIMACIFEAKAAWLCCC